MIDLKQQNELFTLLGEKLKKRVECYVIGGSAMLYYGMKGATKDIDLVFEHEEDRKEFENLLKTLGYKERAAGILYFRKQHTPILLEREETRFDLFLSKIISTVLSDAMKARVESVYEYNLFVIKVLSPEDLIITKCATERAGDRKDAVEIMKKATVNWETIINESIYQSTATPYLFPVFLFDFLYELKEDLKADIPKEVLNRVRKLGEDMMIKKMKKQKKIKLNTRK